MRPLMVTSGTITKRETRSINNYFNELNQFDVLTPEEENDLAFRIKDGDTQARDKLIKHNLRFVVSVAKQYEGPKHKIEDLINEGNLGLIKAAESFDATRGFKFISYAVWHIRQKIMAYLKDSDIMRIPVNKAASLNKIKKLIETYNTENDTPMGYNEETEFLRNHDFTMGDIRFYRNSHNVRVKSLDALFNSDDSNSSDLTAILEDPDSESPTSDLDYNSTVHNRNHLMFNTLTELETFVVERSFGFDGGDGKRVEEIGRELGISGTRAGQIKRKALRKLRYKLKNQADWMVLN